MKKRDIYFIVFLVFIVAFLGFIARVHRFKPIPATAYHKDLAAPDDCIHCHQHPKTWSLPPGSSKPLPPNPAPDPALLRPVPEAHPTKSQCFRCHEHARKP